MKKNLKGPSKDKPKAGQTWRRKKDGVLILLYKRYGDGKFHTHRLDNRTITHTTSVFDLKKYWELVPDKTDDQKFVESLKPSEKVYTEFPIKEMPCNGGDWNGVKYDSFINRAVKRLARWVLRNDVWKQ